MSWNYRVMIKDGQFGIHEVFYEDDGHISGYTADPVYPRGDSLEELVEEFPRYHRALSEPVLNFEAMEAEAAQRRAFEA